MEVAVCLTPSLSFAAHHIIKLKRSKYTDYTIQHTVLVINERKPKNVAFHKPKSRELENQAQIMYTASPLLPNFLMNIFSGLCCCFFFNSLFDPKELQTHTYTFARIIIVTDIHLMK